MSSNPVTGGFKSFVMIPSYWALDDKFIFIVYLLLLLCLLHGIKSLLFQNMYNIFIGD